MSGNGAPLYGYLRMPLIIALRQGPDIVDAPFGGFEAWGTGRATAVPGDKNASRFRVGLHPSRGEKRASLLTMPAMNAPE